MPWLRGLSFPALACGLRGPSSRRSRSPLEHLPSDPGGLDASSLACALLRGASTPALPPAGPQRRSGGAGASARPPPRRRPPPPGPGRRRRAGGREQRQPRGPRGALALSRWLWVSVPAPSCFQEGKRCRWALLFPSRSQEHDGGHPGPRIKSAGFQRTVITLLFLNHLFFNKRNAK